MRTSSAALTSPFATSAGSPRATNAPFAASPRSPGATNAPPPSSPLARAPSRHLSVADSLGPSEHALRAMVRTEVQHQLGPIDSRMSHIERAVQQNASATAALKKRTADVSFAGRAEGEGVAKLSQALLQLRDAHGLQQAQLESMDYAMQKMDIAYHRASPSRGRAVPFCPSPARPPPPHSRGTSCKAPGS